MTDDMCVVGSLSGLSSDGEDDRRAGSSPKSATILTAVWLIVVLALVSLRAWEFYAAGFDLGVFVQAFRTMMLHGLLATVPMLGQSFLEDHFSPLALLLVLFIALLWVFLGRIGWRSWLVAVLLLTPLALLDLPVLDHAGSHFFLPLGIVLGVGAARGCERFVSSLRSVPYSVVALPLVVGPLVSGVSGYQVVPGWHVGRLAMQDASSADSMHAWVNSLAFGESVSAVNPRVPWIEATDAAWVWPSPLKDVIAPVGEQSRLGPTGETVGLGKLGFVRRSVSSLEGFVWWQRP